MDRSRHAAPQIIDDLRERIVALELLPGTVLSRAELQAAYTISSTPLRDALLKLQEEGLVEIYPQHATIVAPIDIAHARQAHFLRRSVEVEIARSLAMASDKSFVPKLRALIEEQSMYEERGLVARFADADLAFHHAAYEAAGVPDLWTMIRRASGHIDRIRRLDLPAEGKMSRIISDHTAMTDAMEKGDVEAAQHATRDHLSRSITLTDAMKQKNPDYFRG